MSAMKAWKRATTLLGIGVLVLSLHACNGKPAESTANILGRVLCETNDGEKALEEASVTISSKETTTANDGTFILNAVVVGSLQHVTISGKDLARPFRSTVKIENNIKIVVPKRFCAANTSHEAGAVDGGRVPGVYRVVFTEPREGTDIQAFGPGVTQRPCRGRLQGTPPFAGLVVRVTIETDQVYPQGTSSVREDGTWEVSPCYFGGDQHLVKAVVLRGASPVAEGSITVRRVRR